MRPYSLLACVVLFPLLLRGDASREDWVGDYSINHDGHVGTLSVFASAAGCRSPQCPGLGVRYTDENGATYSGTASALDDNGQHLAFTLEFPGNAQRFDVYIFSFDKTKLAGTTVWGGRVFGVMATRNNLKRAAIMAAEKPKMTKGQSATQVLTPQAPATGSPTGTPQKMLMPDGSIELRYPDGTIKTKRIGGCGWNIRYPDGRVQNAQCLFDQVIQVIPPDPPAGTSQANWLNSQDDDLLNILKGLLGGANSADFGNYLKNYENPPNPVIYKRIHSRTQAIEELVAAQ